MTRAFALVTIMLAASNTVLVQAPSVLHIKVTVPDAEGRSVPVPRHALLVSDNPVTAAPHRIVTSPEGTADINLRPGSYIVESDAPANLGGRAYEWSVIVTVAADRDTTLALTAGNAHVDTAPIETVAAAPAEPPAASATVALAAWEPSVVGLWTPRVYNSGFLIDANGLIATSRHSIGDATAIEVQVSATVKVAATVLVADEASDVAILRVHPAAVSGLQPLPVVCAQAPAPGVDLSDLLTIEAPMHRPKSVTSVASSETAGGPVFAADGAVIGLTSGENGGDRRRSPNDVVRAEAVCPAMTTAASKMEGAAPPDGTHLPVESGPPLPAAAITAAMGGRAFTPAPYRISSSDFDIVFLTPLARAGAEAQKDRSIGADDNGLGALVDFWNWADYLTDVPPLLLIRVSPRLAESLWMKMARGAAVTQGMSLPAIKRLRPGFSQMRVLCGAKPVTPIHPFRIQRRVSETEAVEEGLYVFDPAAIGPQCGTVSLVLSTVKDPTRTETRIVDPAVIKRIAQDFASLQGAR